MSPRTRSSAVALTWILLLSSCGGDSTTTGDAAVVEPDPPAAVATTTATPTAPATDASDSDGGTPRRPEPVAAIGDLDDDPFIIFAPVGPYPIGDPDAPLPDGSDDYWELFADGAEWQEALGNIDAFKIHAWQARARFGDVQIREMVDFLAEHDIPLVVEMEPLQPPDPAECDHTESFEGPYELQTAQKIKRNGGVIAAVVIEQPYTFAHKMEGDGACQYTIERITDELVTWVADLREIFPDVVVGSIEGIWSEPATSPDDMAIWLDAYEAALGEPLAFLHMDTNWNRADWADVAVGIEAVAEDRGVRFGMLINGGLEQRNDEWLQFAAERMAEFAAAGGTPEHVTFQSWVEQPDRVLPETDIGAFTHLINRYLGTQDPIESVAINGEDPGTISGRLTDSAGAPLAGLTVEATIRNDPNQLQQMRLTGTVPDAADGALVLLRSNAEDAAPGELDAVIHSISFTQADGANRVQNGDFAAGDAAWGGDPATTGDVGFDPGDGGTLRLRATTGQPIYLNSAAFAVDAGAEFEFTVSADIAELAGAAASGQVAVAFLDGDQEAGRQIIDLITQFVTLPSVATDADGHFTIDAGDIDVTSRTVIVSTPGDLHTWPDSVTLVPRE